MLPVFIDTHAHLDAPEFEADVADVVARARTAGITAIICVGTCLTSSTRAIQLAGQFPEIHAAVGWHPSDAMQAPDDIRPALRELARQPKVVAIGETGLDYYRLPSSLPGGTAADDAPIMLRQRELFRQHLEIAAETGLPCIVHQRGDALAPTLAELGAFAGRVHAVFHCFVDDMATAQTVLASGHRVSFTGILTFKNAQRIRDTLSRLPLNSFMLETDCPYLAPVPHRGKRCEPAHVADIAQAVARIKGCTLQELSEATCATARAFFPRLAQPPHQAPIAPV